MEKYRMVAVILNYKTYDDAIECVNSLLDMNYENHFIVIVDNGSGNGSYERMVMEYKGNEQVIILKSEVNLGFAKGNNLGIKYAREVLAADFVYVANSDTVVNGKELYNQVMKEYHTPIGVISPTVKKADNSYHMPAVDTENIYKTAYLAIRGIIYSYFFAKSKEKRKQNKSGKVKEPVKVPEEWKKYVIHGCAYFLTPDFFKYYTCIYPKTFLYWEEINVLMYIQKAKLESILISTEPVLHKVNISTNTFFDNGERQRLKMSLLSGMASLPMFFLGKKIIRKVYD